MQENQVNRVHRKREKYEIDKLVLNNEKEMNNLKLKKREFS